MINKKRRVIITVNTYYPEKNGVQAVTGYLAEGMAKKGIDVVVVTQLVNGYPQSEVHNGVNIIRHNIYTKHAIHKGDIKGYRKLIKKLTETADAIINVCPQSATTDSILPILKEIKCKKILYMHGMHSFKFNHIEIENISLLLHKIWNNARWFWLYYINGKWFKNYNKIIQIHRFDGTYDFFYKRYSIESDIIENAADDAFFISDTHSNKFIENSQVNRGYIINVSNYIPRKNQIATLHAYYKSETNMPLILIGSSKTDYYYDLLKAKTVLEQKYGNKNVEILTDVPRDKIPEYVKNASLYIMNSRWEVFPISLIESMASGVPFITSDVGISKYLPGGVIANTIDETTYWINLFNKDRDIMKHYSAIGHKYANEHLTIQSKVEKLISIIYKE